MLGLLAMTMAPAIGPPVPTAIAGCSQRSLNENVLRSADYPADALLAGQVGHVRIEIDVSPAGCPLACRVAESSGLASFDETACRAMMERARFRAPLGDDYRPMSATVKKTVRWLLP